MHAGHLEQAESLLASGLRVPLGEVRGGSAPPSQMLTCDVSPIGGRAKEALRIVTKPLTAHRSVREVERGVTTRTWFLHPERGASMQLGREHEAEAISSRRNGQLEDLAYPSLGAIRGLACALRRRQDRMMRTTLYAHALPSRARDGQPIIPRSQRCRGRGVWSASNAGPSPETIEDVGRAFWGRCDESHIAAVFVHGS